ncbi:DUF302 domain-containing protein [Gramella lutea]|uniref:DUF302 domain-containing protein n=1 Tax=Christiangramia lutea TaxID=1607951 RepID=A0A9X2A822_9FLAO|nr:DUF302 domain-containing protein [Christiangramia lutea]MCH4821830.1 DUF302 domain-containing protein [Christiangramia lutea]
MAIAQTGNEGKNMNNGIIMKESDMAFEETYHTLKNTLTQNPAISIMAEVDHQKNAKASGLDLRPTRLIIFGNPKMGTPMMQENQSIAIDLPQKILVWENSEGDVFVSYNNPYFIAERHSIENNAEVLEKISEALDKLTNIATGN